MTTAESVAAAASLLNVRAAAAPAPPAREIGQEYQSIRVGTEPERAFYTDQDYVPELIHPLDIPVYSQMSKDSQIHGLWTGTMMPIRRYRWSIDPAGASEEDARAQAKALGLPIRGEDPSPRSQTQAFSFDRILARVLLAPRYRYFHFELVGETAQNGRGAWTLKRLAARPPWTLAYDGIHADRHGDLVSITQQLDMESTPIPASQIAAFVWGEEEGGYLGSSMLRPLYADWFLKRTLLKINTVNHELNGAGTVVGIEPEGATPADKASLLAAGNSMRAEPHRAVSIPFGASLLRQGVQGSTPDTIASIRYHDQQMSKAMMQMVIDLGATPNGSRALGDTFADLLGLGQQAIASWAAASFTQQVLAKITALNYGPDAECPVLCFERDEHPDLSVADLAALADKGLVTPDPELEDYLRTREGLPARAPISTQESAPPAAVITPVAAAGVPPSLAERGMRRMLTEQEIRAGADFDAIDNEWRTALGTLLEKVRGAQATQIRQLAEQVKAAANDPVALANLTGTAYGADAIASALLKMAGHGSRQVVGEARKQGVKISGASEEDFADPLRRRAQAAAQTLGNGLAQSASRKAQSLVGLSPEEVKTRTVEHLTSLTDAFLVDTLGGELTGAQNEGRRAAMQDFPVGTTFYASELLDGSTCGPCADVDGREYGSLEEAQADYPGSAGFVGCDGGPRCRGTLIAVAPDETPASVGLDGRS